MPLEAIQHPPTLPEPCRGLIVLLHGWGANAQDLVDLSPALDIPGVQFLFPNAPMAHPYSEAGRMWYDLESSDWQGLDAARSQLNQWLDDAMAKFEIPPEKVILAGFSQGGAMTLDVGLGRSLAGLVVFSGYLHPHLAKQSFDLAPPSPILVIHGEQDPVVPFQAALQTQSTLSQWKANFQFQSFTMGHEISLDALNFARQFITDRLNLASS